MTLHATFPAATLTAAPGGRRISGTAVPWGEIGTVSDGRRVRFLPGSIDAAARPVVLRDHDPSRPVGRVVDARETANGIDVDTTISATVAGDEAMILASDGILAAWSVGVDPTDTQPGDDGVLEIVAGNWRELSLLTFGAFQSARVVDVAAEQGPEDDDEDEVPEDEPKDPDPEEEPVSTTQLEPVHAGTTVPVGAITATPRPTPPTDLNAVANVLASMPNAGAAAIQAALADITTGVGSAGAVTRAAFTDQIGNLIELGRPTINAISRAPLPPSGMRIEWPQWTTLPDVGLQATQKTEITSRAAVIGTGSADILTWAGGNDVALQLAQRSSPSFLEQWVRAASEEYARETNGYVVTQLLAAAEVVPPPTTPTFLNSIAALMAGFDPATAPNGQLFLAMSWDVGMVMVGVPVNSGPAFWSGNIGFGSVVPSVSAGGLNMYIDRQLPAKTMLLGVSSGATWYEMAGAPAELRVIDVALLGINIAVWGMGALGLTFAGAAGANPAFEKMTFTTLPAGFADDEGGTRKAK